MDAVLQQVRTGVSDAAFGTLRQRCCASLNASIEHTNMSSAVSPVFAIVAERYRDAWDDWTGDAVPHELKHVVRLSDIAQMSPELERVISRVAPQIRIDFSKAAGVSYWLNHCSTCGARFGDFFLGEIDGLF
jgi:hypothetical protein